MIVKCERCQTRFKIPDEKVTEKGVKVRCTKCQNTFRVTREAAAGAPGEPPAPSSGGQVDPFAQFGVAPDPTSVDVTKPGYFELGVEASRPMPARPGPPGPSWNSMDGDLGSEDGVFREPTRITSLPLPPAARPPDAPVGRAPPPGAFVVRS
ncbi:zinc-ribbon domain-containing protein [Myxococcus sp. MxC21-1]|uniref:zinc-ribbon domain-containing protein n=1 Tax=Myxococcus sp. MxC21-1 TaxID=3041439 RepID=UPI00292CB606|nr:zinc-ribbon domain-containing protein [Myxococcus sp. MxC21-1]WNZ60549.1 zinc-ribbon domain-containing protein [Myxococcus sp. MxC21-1]